MWSEILKQQINLIRNKTKIIKGKIKIDTKANLLASQVKQNKVYQILDWKINVILSKSKTTIIIKENKLKKNLILKVWDTELNNLNKQYKYNWETVKENNKIKKLYIKKPIQLKKWKYKINKSKKKFTLLKIKKLRKMIYKLYWKNLIFKWNKIYVKYFISQIKLKINKLNKVQKRQKNKEIIKGIIWKIKEAKQRTNFLIGLTTKNNKRGRLKK